MDSAASRPRKTRRLWTAAQVAAFLQVSRSWVYQRVASGELPSLRFGGHVRFEPDAIEDYARGVDGRPHPP